MYMYMYMYNLDNYLDVLPQGLSGCCSRFRRFRRARPMSEVDGEIRNLERTARKADGDSKSFSDDTQAVLRQQR